MVKILHSLYNRQIDKLTASKLTLINAIDTNPMLMNNAEALLSGARSFLTLWSKLNKNVSARLSARIVSEIKSREHESMKTGLFAARGNHDDQDVYLELEKNVPLTYLLPAAYGQGVFIHALILYLIETQNEFVNFMGEGGSGAVKVDLDGLTPNDCISVSANTDVLNIVYLNSNYSLEHAGQLNFEFNYDKIQENIVAKFLTGKAPIDNSVILSLYFHSSLNYNLFEILEHANHRIL